MISFCSIMSLTAICFTLKVRELTDAFPMASTTLYTDFKKKCQSTTTFQLAPPEKKNTETTTRNSHEKYPLEAPEPKLCFSLMLAQAFCSGFSVCKQRPLEAAYMVKRVRERSSVPKNNGKNCIIAERNVAAHARELNKPHQNSMHIF